LVDAIGRQRKSGVLDVEVELVWPKAPGRPLRPQLVEPRLVPRRSPFTTPGLGALLHSVAHIEFNAINLALDAVWRFPRMPAQYYRDWIKVAAEEANHFSLLDQQLSRMGYAYGDFDAHDGLWTMCESTRDDIVARMALVPRTMEARGLDATPMIQKKLAMVATADALESIRILDIILREEVDHVSTGNRWFHWLCKRDGLHAGNFHSHAALRHGAPRPKPPFNLEARKRAGFTDAELMELAECTKNLLHQKSEDTERPS
jgi:uncharacterized ferritin-like protein (DUF455 family)